MTCRPSDRGPEGQTMGHFKQQGKFLWMNIEQPPNYIKKKDAKKKKERKKMQSME